VTFFFERIPGGPVKVIRQDNGALYQVVDWNNWRSWRADKEAAGDDFLPLPKPSQRGCERVRP
jgi:hypothetical protein